MMAIKEKRFDFGKNWQDFSGKSNLTNYKQARVSLAKLVPDIKNKKFLDVGCGAGLFSIAALDLGAVKVDAFDVNPKSIESSRKNLFRYIKHCKNRDVSKIKFYQDSILEFKMDPPEYDVVYSWGVLHHTGRMWEAFERVSKYVRKNGVLVIAIYSKHFTSGIWKSIKRFYNVSPPYMKKLTIYFFYPLIFFGKIIFFRTNPFSVRRGMSFYHNVVDWVGGYPYEYASIGEVTTFFESLGFKLKKTVKAKGFLKCNEYVFVKEPGS